MKPLTLDGLTSLEQMLEKVSPTSLMVSSGEVLRLISQCKKAQEAFEIVKIVAMGHDGRCSYEDLGCYQCRALKLVAAYRSEQE